MNTSPSCETRAFNWAVLTVWNLQTPSPSAAGVERSLSYVWSVAHCLRVVLDEYCEHRRYAERDLGALEARLRQQ